mmetsp:Transcript_14978/g.22796  ORF Transcript_14978/g.22796 Transcript_14978/m.22796 type:complete len:196 (+) Transcript_14978:280-867(+)
MVVKVCRRLVGSDGPCEADGKAVGVRCCQRRSGRPTVEVGLVVEVLCQRQGDGGPGGADGTAGLVRRHQRGSSGPTGVIEAVLGFCRYQRGGDRSCGAAERVHCRRLGDGGPSNAGGCILSSVASDKAATDLVQRRASTERARSAAGEWAQLAAVEQSAAVERSASATEWLVAEQSAVAAEWLAAEQSAAATKRM